MKNILDAAGAALAAVLAFAAVPVVLVLVVGDPFSSGLGHAWRPLPRDALCVLVLAAWAAWAACCAQLLRAVVAHVRRGEVGVQAGASVLERIAARIAVGVLAVATLGASITFSSGAGASTLPGRAAARTPAAPARTPAPVHAVGPHAEIRDLAERGHPVRPGETVWSIARSRLGDGSDGTAIAALNLGRDMVGGARFVDPDHIRPGWRLRLPPDAGMPLEEDDEADDGIAREAVDDAAPRAAGTRSGGWSEHLPELVVLGVGSLVCAALARRNRRPRQQDRFTGELMLPRTPSEGAVDTAALLHRFDDVPALAAFETANCLLAGLLEQRHGPPPTVRAICVGPSGVAFLLATPDPDAPEPFTATSDGRRWHVEHGRLHEPETLTPAAPVALPVGDDDDGTWFVVLDAGGVLPVLGESALALVRSMSAAQDAWAWSEQLVVTDDPEEATRAAAAGLTAGPVLAVFIGDPCDLDAAARPRVATVTTDPLTPSDVSVLVDRHGASIHPIGRVVRPHLMDAETFGSIGELTASAAVAELDATPEDAEALAPTADPAPSPDERTPTPSSTAVLPGAAEVRLLTQTPRLDGLREELPPNRARRAVELVAYLALHHPDVVTSDRLRTRVLGSSDADAAAKTLFNTAHAARRAMGTDHRGDPLFPAATRNGLYTVSEQVTVDVRRAAALVQEGKTCEQTALAMAHFRSALELVEGEPLANALAGYSWWEAEGHGGRIGAVLVDAACRLAGLALDAGLFGLARLGLERARLVEPYSEALSQAAMQVAAAEGDADRLRREWLDCQRRADALDPGGSPSPVTESLYGELLRAMPVGADPSSVEEKGYASAD